MLYFLDHTESDPAANLAVDEALLDWVNESELDNPLEVLRLWMPSTPFVVIGRSSILADEVEETACQQRSIPILRRGSGGTAVVTGPGCLMYAVILSLKDRPELRMIDLAHRFVLSRIASAISRCGIEAQCAGTSDVTVGDQKVSGNSLRMSRNALLYHGTILLDFDLSLMNCLTKSPPRQPEYRQARSHEQFVRNLRLPADFVKTALREIWQADRPLIKWPRERVERFVLERFGQRAWTYQR
jgi:lipoate---protein ligase